MFLTSGDPIDTIIRTAALGIMFSLYEKTKRKSSYFLSIGKGQMRCYRDTRKFYLRAGSKNAQNVNDITIAHGIKGGIYLIL